MSENSQNQNQSHLEMKEVYTVGYNTILSELLLPPYLVHSYAKK